MKRLSIILSLLSLVIWTSSCNQNHGCTEPTADNYDPEAKNDDGTCVPARDKMIGNYTYTRFWTDVFTEQEAMDMGSFQVTEANTGDNAFNMFLNGKQIIQGSVSSLNISIEQFNQTDTFFSYPFTQTYNGNGTWLVSDSVDFTFHLTTQVPIDFEVNPSLHFVTVPLTYNYYCTKVN